MMQTLQIKFVTDVVCAVTVESLAIIDACG